MARYAYSLLLTTPEAYQAGRVDPGELPADVPAALPAAAPAVSNGLLLGEILGVDVAPAVEALEVATRATALRRESDEDAERLLFGEDLPALRNTFIAVAEAASSAVDRAGRPTGPAGDKLVASDHVTVDEQGQAFIGTQRMRVADLLDRLPDLARFMDTAASRDLLVVTR